jgi:hypothetical protein
MDSTIFHNCSFFEELKIEWSFSVLPASGKKQRILKPEGSDLFGVQRRRKKTHLQARPFDGGIFQCKMFSQLGKFQYKIFSP